MRELFTYRQVLFNLVIRNLKVKYQRSVLGFVWTLLYPAFMLGIYWLVFGLIMPNNVNNFWAYLIAGLLPFQFIMSGLMDGSASIRTNSNLIRKIYFPQEILVISTVTAKLVEFLLQLAVAIVFLAVAHHGNFPEHFSPLHTLVVLPAAIVLLYLFVLGMAMPLAAWSVIYRDIEHILGIALTAWFYITPIFWTLEMARNGLHNKGLHEHVHWFVLNPAVDFIELFRGPLFRGEMPDNQALNHPNQIITWLIATGAALISFAGGYFLFNRSKRILAEVV